MHYAQYNTHLKTHFKCTKNVSTLKMCVTVRPSVRLAGDKGVIRAAGLIHHRPSLKTR